uniref:hypothetical protein n=1 Tax=Actinokineospora sp. CA-119265 TaxID=3239890 RepID=UPI003F497473
MIEELALIAHPQPRHGEVEPPEAFAEASEAAAEARVKYAENLRAMVEDTEEDPLLVELRSAAGRRDGADKHVRALLAYGRHCTGGQRSGYSWETLAEAAGMTRMTATRAVTADDVADVRAAVAIPAAERWPQAVANLDVHRAHTELLAVATEHGITGPPTDLDADAERMWWLDTAERLGKDGDKRAEMRIVWATHRWHNAWLRAVYPRAGQYNRVARTLIDLVGELKHWDPARRHVDDEVDQLDTIIETLTAARDQIKGESA